MNPLDRYERFRILATCRSPLPGFDLAPSSAHCRRYFFEAAVCKYKVGVEGLHRIQMIYRADAELGDLPPSKRVERRRARVAPLVELLRLVERAGSSSRGRTLATKALGYAHDGPSSSAHPPRPGRLPLGDNTERRALRKIVVGRKNWLFYGSETHAESAAAIFSIIASCRLHRLDVLDYIADVLRAPTGRRTDTSSLPRCWRAARAGSRGCGARGPRLV
ncbi:MAG: transposase [Polyangiaceae bacterium]